METGPPLPAEDRGHEGLDGEGAPGGCRLWPEEPQPARVGDDEEDRQQGGNQGENSWGAGTPGGDHRHDDDQARMMTTFDSGTHVVAPDLDLSGSLKKAPASRM